MPTSAGTPHVTTKLGRAVEIASLRSARSWPSACPSCSSPLQAQTEPAWRRDPGHHGPPPLIHYYGTGAPRTVTRIHTTPATVPSAPRPWSGKPQSKR